jgi:hypothetical protein
MVLDSPNGGISDPEMILATIITAFMLFNKFMLEPFNAVMTFYCFDDKGLVVDDSFQRLFICCFHG